MVVCQFFMQGRCNFGDKCYNEHPTSPAAEKNAFLRIDKKLFESLVTDVIATEKGNQWPLSCYAPFRDHPTVPNLNDTSSDELRQSYYQAKLENRLEEYASQVSGLIKVSDDMRKFLKTPSAELGTVLENIFNKKVTDQVSPESNFSTFRFSSENENKSDSIFGGSASSPQSANVFSQVGPTSSNLFSSQNDQQSSASNQSVFGGSSSVFNAQSNQNIFAQNTSGNIFGNSKIPPNDNHHNVFSNSNNSEKLFQQTSSKANSFNLFGAPDASDMPFQQNKSTRTSLNIFPSDNTSSVFGNPSSTSDKISNIIENCYSVMESLTEEEKAMFIAPKFSYQKIPLQPPPESLCK